MPTLSFNELTFEDKGDKIMVNFQSLFYFELEKAILKKIGDYEITRDAITFKNISEKRAFSRFDMLLNQGLNNLRSKLTNKKVIYIHKNSGIPLIGTNYFGIIDRGTNIIELKPMNGCNLDCIYCSVDEGFSSTRAVDFIVEKGYLVSEFKKLVEFKNMSQASNHSGCVPQASNHSGCVDCIHAQIAGQGETLMYREILGLINDISKVPSVKIISVITNGTLLTKEFIDKLADAGLTRLNVSLNALEQSLANKIANRPYNLEHVKEMIRYASKSLEVILVPVLIPTINDKEIPNIIEFVTVIKAEGGNIKLGIQNFLNYRFGRNPVKELSWEEFYNRLSALESSHDANLRYKEDTLIETKELPKPFKKGDTVTAKIICDGRLKGEKLAIADSRCITIPNCNKYGLAKVKIVRSKHNIFVGVIRQF